MSEEKGFFAYPSKPKLLGDTIESALEKYENISSWQALDIIGHFVAGQVVENIDDADFTIADISRLNFNVTYEIGYAIGRKKRVLLVKNKSIQESKPSIREVGIFDTLGYKEYENSAELVDIIKKASTKNPLEINSLINQRAPVYLLETLYKTDWASRIISRIKKARFIFRSFDPNETPRLSAYDAITQVSQSHGIVVPLVSGYTEGNEVHNMRAAFIAGLAEGMNKALCILQDGDDPVPLDYRDFVNVTYHPDEINEHIGVFAGKVMEAFQEGVQYKVEGPTTFLQGLDLGASSAENEMRTLESYYLTTDQFLKSLRGEAHLVVGRKGSGKSAIFLQIRDRERSKGKNIVLDLKPEGYKLIKFKELILRRLEEGTYQHTIMAFWEYVLLLEICYKILEADRERHLHDHHLYDAYNKLNDLYRVEGYDAEGDFSERMSGLMEKITTEYQARYGDQDGVSLSVPELTEILYLHDVKNLTQSIVEYLRHKDTLWLLFDNVDKGWPTKGLQHEDLVIIRTLIDATRKIERQFGRYKIEVNSIVFLRNDVYELLVRETSDRGKEANVHLDWADPDLLREMLRLRILSNDLDTSYDFEQIWPRVCISHVKGEESSQYLIERSLMRPRFLINLINQCKSYAVNLNHEKIEEDDIMKGLGSYSSDLLTDIGYELRDILPKAEDILYAFIESKKTFSHNECAEILKEFHADAELTDKIIELLLWYGFLGVNVNGEDQYIYSFNYNMQLLKGVIRKHKDDFLYIINPSFWPALMIS